MLNLRDITKLENLHETIENHRILKRIYASIGQDFIGPFQSINYLCDTMIHKTAAAVCCDKNMNDTMAIQQNCKFIANTSKFASIRAKNFLDLSMIERGAFKPLMSPISLH